MIEKLKPCPFCGGEAVVENDFSDYSFIVHCLNCYARTGTFMMGMYGIPDDEIEAQKVAVDAWNRRTNDE